MSAKHTPGPWTIQRFGRHKAIRSPSGVIVCETSEYANCQDQNARLIAAAPDMLEALRDAEAFIGWEAHIPDVIERIRAAIRKAEGGE